MKLFSREQPLRDSLAIKVSLKERIRDEWTDLHLLWKSLIVIAVLAVLAIPFYGRAIKATKTRTYAQDLAAAKKALSDGRDADARDLSLALLRREPKNTEPMPLLMHAAAGAKDPLLVPVARGYLEMNTQNKPDRVFAWTAISKEYPMGSAGIIWLSSIRDNEREDPDFLVPWLERLKTERLGHEIEDLLAKQTGLLDPRIERIRLSILAIRGTENSYRELQARLFDRIASHPADGAVLIDSIDEVPQSAVIPYSFTALGEWLKASGQEPSVENQLRLARCEMVANPETAEAILNRITTEFTTTAPLPLAKLFVTLRRFDRAEELLKPLVSKGGPGVFLLMAKVLENQQKLDEWDQLLASPPKGIFLPGVLCDRAFLAAKKGDERAKINFEQEASVYAEKLLDSDSLIHLARYAADRGMNEYSLSVWVKAIRKGPSSPLPLFVSISPVFETLARDKQDNQLLDTLTVYRAADPGNLDVITQHLYLACLIGSVTPQQVLDILLPLKEKFNSQPLNLPIALAELLEGRTALADKLTGDTKIDWFTQIPAARAIRSITLTKIGRKGEADIYMEDFPWEGLLPCEKRVFKELLEAPQESKPTEVAGKSDQLEKAKIAEGLRQAQKAKELMEIRKAREASESAKSEEQKIAEKKQKAEQLEKSKIAEELRQAQRAKELMEIRNAREARESAKPEEQKIAEKNQKAEKARLADEALRVLQSNVSNEVREKLAAQAAKEAAEAKETEEAK